MLGENTLLYNLTKNMNTFPFFDILTINHEIMAGSQCDVSYDHLQWLKIKQHDQM